MNEEMKNSGPSRAQKRLIQQFENDVRAALDHAPTRRLLGQIIEETGVFLPVMPSQIDGAAAFENGRRSVGLGLIDALNRVSPGAFIAIQTEAFARVSKNAADMAEEFRTVKDDSDDI